MDELIKLKNKLMLQQKMKQFKQTNHKSINSLRTRPKSAQTAQQVYKNNSSSKQIVKQRAPSASNPVRQKLMQTPQKKTNQSPFKHAALQSTNAKQKTTSSSGSLKKPSKSKSKKDIKTTKVNLKQKTAYLSKLVTKSSELIFQQRQLQQRIKYYKQQIAAESRKVTQSTIIGKKYQQQNEQIQARIKNKIKQSKIVNEKVIKQREQILSIKQSIDTLTQQSQTLKGDIKRLAKSNKPIKQQNQQCQNQIRKTQKQVGEIKDILRESQKKLTMQTVQKQELVQQKNGILVNTNQIMSSIYKQK